MLRNRPNDHLVSCIWVPLLAMAAVGLLTQPGCGDDESTIESSPDGGSGGTAGQGGSATGVGGHGAAGEGGGALACPEQPPLTTSALVFDGDDAVSMGLAPELGAAVLTLEAWVRRDGPGADASTGVGGVRLVPIISKGRGEDDGSNVDCNYAFGLVGDVLAADFEDYESGANHPVLGQSPLTVGRWHHVAATYDGDVWRLYLDGVLDGEATANATPRYDSIQHFGLGVAFNSTGVAAGALDGALDEVRVYSRALSESELQATMFSTTPSQDGLIGHFHLDAADGAVLDSSGNENDGTVTGATFVTPGAVLDRGHAPTIGNPAAEPLGAQGARLSVDVADADGDPVYVDFFARELTAADEFTIVIMPDSQYYTRTGDDPTYFYAQTQWTVDHRVDRNVVGLGHVGDMVNNADTSSQWNVAETGMEILESFVDPSLPDGMPYSPGVGNHDQDPNGDPAGTSAYNGRFGVDRFAGRSYFGGAYGDDNDNHWVRFRAGGLEIILLSFEYDPEPPTAALAWARRVFETHPRAFGIVNSHSILNGDMELSGQGSAIYEALKDVDNVQLMASGHVSLDARRTFESNGNLIHVMLSDYQRAFPSAADPENPEVGDQGTTNGGRGYMRIWRFSPADQMLHVESYSPKLDASYTDELNEFSLPVDLVGAGSGILPLGRALASQGHASVDLSAFGAGRSFEWYAVATDCAHETPLELQLLTAPGE